MYLLTLNLSRKITAVANLINCVRDVRSFLIPFLSTPSTANVNRGGTQRVLLLLLFILALKMCYNASV
jgi:hypothetical protein